MAVSNPLHLSRTSGSSRTTGSRPTIAGSPTIAGHSAGAGSPIMGKLTPGESQPVPGIPGFAAPLMDARGSIAGFGAAGTKEAASHSAAFLAAAATLCHGLPLAGILAGRFAIVDVDPSDPFGVPDAPVARFKTAIIQLLTLEEFLQDPGRFAVFEPHLALVLSESLPDTNLPDTNLPPDREPTQDVVRRARAQRIGILRHLNQMLDLDFTFTEDGGAK